MLGLDVGWHTCMLADKSLEKMATGGAAKNN